MRFSDTLSRFSWSLALALIVLLSGCDLLGGEDDEEPATTGVYVANQGNFTEGTGSVSVYNPQTEDVTPRAVSNLSSTVQSIQLTDDRLYVMANSGNYVNAYALDNLTQVAQYALTGPRYMAIAGEDKAFVTRQLFTGSSMVSVIDIASDAVTDSILVNGTPEGITVAGNRAYVALGAFSDTTLVAAINTETNALIEEIDIGCYARFVYADADDEVFAFCNTDAGDGEAVVLDGPTGTVNERIDLGGTVASASGVTQAAAYAPGAQEMYVVLDQNTLARLDTRSHEKTATLQISGAPIGAVGYDAVSQRLYVGHVPGFGEERGTVTIHERSGDQTGSFTAGIAPTYIAFRQAE